MTHLLVAEASLEGLLAHRQKQAKDGAAWREAEEAAKRAQAAAQGGAQ